MPSLQGLNKKMIVLQRNKVDGTLLENIKSIESELDICEDKTKKAELLGAMDVAKEIQKKVLLSTIDAAKIYKELKATFLNKEVSDYFCAIDTYEKLAKHLNIDQMYIKKRPIWLNQRVPRLKK